MSDRYRRLLIPILILVAAAVWVDLPTNPGIHVGGINRAVEVVRGLDLQGGLRVLLEALGYRGGVTQALLKNAQVFCYTLKDALTKWKQGRALQ